MNADAAQNIDKQTNPLEELAHLLASDMNAVNETIMTRMQSSVPLIPQLASYLIAAGGKRIRPLLTLASTKIFDGDMTRAHLLATAVEFIHTATLLHDDVVDESEQRRGQDAANLVFGNQASVLVGDFLFSRAFQLMVEDGNLSILNTLSNASAVIAEGEVQQLANIGNLQITIEDYIQIITAKTAILFSAACEVGPMIADSKQDQIQAMADYGINLGIAFQIIDDILDYTPSAKSGKNAGDDFREGKLTAPVIYAFQNADTEEKKFLSRAITSENKTKDDFEKALKLIHQYKCIDQSKALAMQYCEAARNALTLIPKNQITDLLDSLIAYNMERLQ